MPRGFFCCILLIFLIIFYSCELFDRKEYIPSYINIENIIVKTNLQTEGTTSHSITDAWIYVDNELIGVFEIPFNVPVLKSGDKKIVIAPGIKNNSSDSHRVIYPVMNDYYIDTLLIEEEITTINPEFRYKTGAVRFFEDFDGVGNIFEISEISDTIIKYISGEEAFEGRSMAFYLDDNRKNFECRSTELYELPDDRPVYLEINHKSTDPFVFGIFAKEYSGSGIIEKRIPVFTFNPSPYEWKKTYIQLNYHLNASGPYSEYRLFFTCSRQENPYGQKTKVFIDNIKIVHL